MSRRQAFPDVNSFWLPQWIGLTHGFFVFFPIKYGSFWPIGSTCQAPRACHEVAGNQKQRPTRGRKGPWVLYGSTIAYIYIYMYVCVYIYIYVYYSNPSFAYIQFSHLNKCRVFLDTLPMLGKAVPSSPSRMVNGAQCQKQVLPVLGNCLYNPFMVIYGHIWAV